MGHNINGPSSFFRRLLCPGSGRMEAGFPDTDNEHSLRGTAAHKVGELCLIEGKAPGYWLHQQVEVPKVDGTTHVHTFNAEDNEAVWAYINYVNTRLEQMGPDATMEVEVRSDPGLWEGRDDVAGTVDCKLLSPRELEIIDYKHGSGVPVEPEKNPQASQYAIGVLAEIDWETTPHDIPVKLTIVQPRCPHPKGPVRTWEQPATYFFELVEEYKAAAEATDDLEAPLVPGEAQCRFCKAKGSCPAVAEKAMSAFSDTTATTYISNSTVLTAEDQTQAAAKARNVDPWAQVEKALGQPAEVLTIAQKAAILDKAPMITAWLKGVTESLLADAKDGKEVPGYKLVRTKSYRKWGLSDEEMIKKLAAMRTRENKGIGKATVCTIKPLSITQAEKSLKPQVTERTWRGVEKYVTQPEGAPTLAPLTDPRPPIQEMTEVFKPVTSENPFG